MKFKTIELNNFGRFKGRNLFDTGTTDQKNVILVRGDNDRGKTTLFKAIKFALYGARTETIPELVNFLKASEGPGEMWVDIKFEHEGDEYRIQRIQRFHQTPLGQIVELNGKDEVTIWENNNPKKLVSRESQQQWIDHILPQAASQFFFFDGEEIKQYIEKQQSNKVKQAIEMVLGIKELLNARDDLSQIHIEDFEKEYRKKLKAKSGDDMTKKQMEVVEDEMDQLNELIKFHESSLEGAKAMIKKDDEELKKYASIREKVKEREIAINNLENSKNDLKNKQVELTESRSYSSLLLLNPLLEIIAETEENPPSFSIWESEAAKRLLIEKAKKCLCDAKIDDVIIKILQSKIIEIKPSRPTQLKRIVENLLIREQPKHKQSELYRLMSEASNIDQDIAQWQDTIQNLDKEIGSDKDIGPIIQSIEKRREQTYKELVRIETDLSRAKDNKIEKEKELKIKQKKLEHSINDEEVKSIQQVLEISTKVRNAIDSAIEQFTKQRLASIENHISSIFQRLTNNPQLYKGVEIDDSFEIKVKRFDGTILPTYRYSPSAGASQIVAISMIAGLSRYTTRDAPIVIDTPLGRLDAVHRENLIEFYSEIGKQVIILYQPRELDNKDMVLFNNSIASEWVIESDPANPALSVIKREKNHI